MGCNCKPKKNMELLDAINSKINAGDNPLSKLLIKFTGNNFVFKVLDIIINFIRGLIIFPIYTSMIFIVTITFMIWTIISAFLQIFLGKKMKFNLVNPMSLYKRKKEEGNNGKQ